MTRDNIIGLVVILILMIGYSIWLAPSSEEIAERQRIQDSIRAVQREADTIDKDVQPLDETKTPSDITDHGQAKDPETEILHQQKTLQDAYGVFAGSITDEQDFITLENEVMKLKINEKGGYVKSVELKDYKTYDQKPLKLFYDNEDGGFTLNFFYANRIISTKNLSFEPYFYDERFGEKTHIKIAHDDSTRFAMRLYTDNSTQENPKYIEFAYKLHGNRYMVDFDISFVGMRDVVAANTTSIGLDWKINMPRQEKSREHEQNNSTIYYRYAADGDINKLRENRNSSETLRTSIHWVSFKQQFFSSVIIARNNFLGGEVNHNLYDEEHDNYLKYLSASLDLPYSPREDNYYPMQFYFGPNHYQTLKKYDIELEKQIPLGWGIFGWINRFAIIPIFNFLDGFNMSYGIIILLLTVFLKIVLLPIAYKTHMSSARMRALKPEIDELGKKYPKKEDAMKKQQATMAIYKKAGVNPMSGCVPMLLQLPILIAMFRFFPASIELRQEAFLWADDLSSYDSILDLPFSIPFYGDHVSLFTLLMAISTVIYTRMNNQMMGSTNQMPGMKMMIYFMPVMMLAIFNNFASALSYYYFLTNIITFGQMYMFRQIVNEDAIRRKIQENKKKPVKKSKWQKRLEEIQKQQSNRGKKK